MPELIAWYWFRGWARLLHGLECLGWLARRIGVYCFIVCLVVMVLIALPVTLLLRLLLSPWLNRWMAAYVKRLEEPSGP